KDSLRVGKDRNVGFQVRANRTLIFDRHAPGGWRPATYQEIIDRRDILVEPPADVPADWKARARDSRAGLTVDEVELMLARFPVRVGARSAGLPAKWCVLDARAEGGVRPLSWAELTPERLGGVRVPQWDTSGYAVYGARLAGSGAPFEAVAVLLGGPA